ncbi:MAG: MBL fold metallo-hydrolase [Chloroflexi bacterium]|nr:MBL fold metallo-hydrolase [Chloroflexota bacterium]
MDTRLIFLGAARNVTGSRFLLETKGSRLLIDCGLHQERQLAGRNWERFPASPDTLDAVLLTHAHLDHCGLLPKLVREGFHGKVYCTEATAELLVITLLDSAHIQEEDAAFKKKRHQREGRVPPYPELPLYTQQDAQRCFEFLAPVRYDQHINLPGGVSAVFSDAGHVLGSAMLTLRVGNGRSTKSFIFTGDVGRANQPILPDPTVFHHADYLVIESTYGNRTHEDRAQGIAQLETEIRRTHSNGGNLLVPSFALERSQEILYYVNNLQLQGRIPRFKVFLDSPMAVSVTGVFKKHPELFDAEMKGLVTVGNSPFAFKGLSLVSAVEDSKAIADVSGTHMIIAGSGMCNAGRIKYHLANGISDSKNTVIFVGYQAYGTLGRQITDGAKEVRIFGRMYPVRAGIVQIHGFSGHSDKDELRMWASNIKPGPTMTFVVHGEESSSLAFAASLHDQLGWKTSVPAYREEFTLE